MIGIDGLRAVEAVWDEVEEAEGLPLTREASPSQAASSAFAPPPPRATLWVPAVHLLCLLQCSARSSCQRLFAQLVRLLAYAVEASTWVSSGDNHPLRASVTMANKRARVVGTALKDQIARHAAEGAVARTSRRVVRCMGKIHTSSQALPS